jgi:hypothetical protein
MAQPHEPQPVKYFVALLYREEQWLASARGALEQHWGVIDFCSEPYHFDMTDYYAPEMGTPLYRRLLSFESLASPTALVAMKLACNELEDMLCSAGARTVNLDCGYCDHHKVVLASAKEAGQKVYLDKGIYADLVARFARGGFVCFEWTFPDFRDGRYNGALATIRSRYLQQRRALGVPPL